MHHNAVVEKISHRRPRISTIIFSLHIVLTHFYYGVIFVKFSNFVKKGGKMYKLSTQDVITGSRSRGRGNLPRPHFREDLDFAPTPLLNHFYTLHVASFTVTCQVPDQNLVVSASTLDLVKLSNTCNSRYICLWSITVDITD